jgi:predicted MFS family arabinose efflux permease
MLAAALLGAGFAAFFQFAPILAERRAVSPGLLYATYGAAIIATRLVGSRLLDRFTVSRVVRGADGRVLGYGGVVSFARARATAARWSTRCTSTRPSVGVGWAQPCLPR